MRGETPPPPAQVEPFVRVLGVEGAVEFLLTFGGTEIYLTVNPGTRNRVAELVGREQAIALAEAAAFLPRRIPTAKPWLAAVHRAWGLPVAEIARKLHVTDVTVRAYLKRHSVVPVTDPRQMKFPGL